MEQRTDKWYAARLGRITGSAVGAILGLSPFMTPRDVMRRMVREYYGAEPEFTGNVATEYGTFHEGGAIAEYQMETGYTVEQCGFFTWGKWLGASPDGLLPNHGLIEVKCPYGLRDKKNPKFKSIDDQPHYYAQIQVQLFVTERKWCDFYQWSPHGTKLERIYYDSPWLDAKIPKLKAFYDDYLEEVKKPDDHLKPKRVEIETPKAQRLIDEYEDLQDVIDQATDRKKEVLQSLVDLSFGEDAIICGKKLTRVEKAGSVSYAKVVKERLPDIDLEPYRGKPSEFWRLT